MDKLEQQEKSEYYVSKISKCLIVAVVCLSVALMAATVVMIGAGVYVTNQGGPMTKGGTGNTKKGDIHFTGDTDETDSVEFDEDEHLLIVNKPDGGFSAHDYKKGLRYTLNPRTYDCYVIPSEPTGRPDSLISKIGGEVQASNVTINFNILKTPIEDTSFIPSKIRSACYGRFYWALETSEMEGNGHAIAKRETERECILWQYMYTLTICYDYDGDGIYDDNCKSWHVYDCVLYRITNGK